MNGSSPPSRSWCGAILFSMSVFTVHQTGERHHCCASAIRKASITEPAFIKWPIIRNDDG